MAAIDKAVRLLIVTSILSFCPLYLPFGFNTGEKV